MSQPFSRLIALVLLAIAAAAAGVVATRSVKGGDSGDSSAQALVQQAFGANDKLKRGKVEATLEATVPGVPAAQLGGPLTMRMTGAFARAPKGNRDRVALDASVKAAGQNIGFGVVSTGREAFIKFGGNYYEVPRSQLQSFYGQAGATEQQAFAALGIDPRPWLENPSDEGVASVGGTQTRHVSAEIDIARVMQDLVGLVRRTQPAGVPAISDEDLSNVTNAIKNPRVDVYTGVSDGILRRLTVEGEIEADDGSGTMRFDLLVSDVNKPQRIDAPTNARPFGALEGDLRSGGLAALTAGGAPTSPQPSTDAAGGDASAQAGALPDDAQAYLACVRKASSAGELQRCGSRLP